MTTTTTLHPLAADYLKRLERAARRLPRGERRELVEEITAHLSEATDPDMSDAEALTVLDRLGDPEDIVDAEPAVEPVQRRGMHEWRRSSFCSSVASPSSSAGSPARSCSGLRARGTRATS